MESKFNITFDKMMDKWKKEEILKWESRFELTSRKLKELDENFKQTIETKYPKLKVRSTKKTVSIWDTNENPSVQIFRVRSNFGNVSSEFNHEWNNTSKDSLFSDIKTILKNVEKECGGYWITVDYIY